MLPAFALAILVGVVCVTSSLAWRLGFANWALPLLCLAAAVAYLVPATAADARIAPHRTMRRLAFAFVCTVMVATALGVLRQFPVADGEAWRTADLLIFHPLGLAGAIQGALIAVLGPLLFAGTCAYLTSERRAQTVIVGGLVFGLGLAAASPVIQWAFGMDLQLRPDLGLSAAARRGDFVELGAVGFFQDPHSFAAYLILGLGIALGMAAEVWSQNRAAAAPYAALALGAAGTLFATGSRGGMVAASIAAGVFAAWYVLARYARQRLRGGLALVLTTVLILIVSVTFVLAHASLRQRVYESLMAVAPSDLWQPLGSAGIEVVPLLQRTQYWQQAIAVMEIHPLWGVGIADSVADDNVHNYFLQIGSQYGIPSLLLLVALSAMAMRAAWDGATRSVSPRPELLAGLLAAQVGFFFLCVVSHPLLLAEIQAPFWIAAALGVALANPD